MGRLLCQKSGLGKRAIKPVDVRKGSRTMICKQISHSCFLRFADEDVRVPSIKLTLLTEHRLCEQSLRTLLPIILVVALGVAPWFACAQDTRPSTQRSILNAPGNAVVVQLFDAFSGQPIANTNIKVESNNGIACVKAPCPDNARERTGRSDVAGRVTIPKSVIQSLTYVSTELHQVARLDDALPGAANVWVIDLFPNRLKEAGEIERRGEKLTGLDLRGYKLVDAETGKALANTRVRIEFPLSDALDTKTNLLGYVFFPVIRALGASMGEPEAWVTADGYDRTKLDFDATQRGTKLKRR